MSALKRNERGPVPLRALRRFVRERDQEQPVQEYCEVCGEPLGREHRHLLDLARRSIVCACEACALLFVSRGAGKGKYRCIPRRLLALPDFQMTDEQWDELRLPVEMAYLFQSGEAGHVLAFYPSPAGAMESLLDLEHWNAIVKANPVLSDLEPDVEALLINRVGQAREYFVVPLDVCYRLVGSLRLSWKGLSGGQEARDAIEAFFADIRGKASPVSQETAGREGAYDA